jgi:hypothetical protein
MNKLSQSWSYSRPEVYKILFFGSANLLSAGMVGLYLAKVLEDVKARPHYIVSEKTGKIGSD